MLKTYKIILPKYIELGKIKIKKHYINIGTYRNNHFITNNNIKKKYLEIIKDQLNIPKIERYKLILQMPFRSNGDLDNGSLHFKYFNDSLTNLNIISDDNMTICTSIAIIPNKEINDPIMIIKVLKYV